eukprot:832865-Pleurochrysis_carterae.AAC.2
MMGDDYARTDGFVFCSFCRLRSACTHAAGCCCTATRRLLASFARWRAWAMSAACACCSTAVHRSTPPTTTAGACARAGVGARAS